jgi:TolB-like protein
MQIWSAEIKEIGRLYDSIKGRSLELEKELERLINASDENMVLVYARRCLEVIITDLCESELKRPRKTEPLQGIIDKLNREEKIPSHIFASMQSLNSQSTFGSHPKEFDPRQVKPVLNNLTTIIEWYLKYKEAQTISKAKEEVSKPDIEKPVDVRELTRKPQKKLIILLSGFFLVAAIVVVALFVFNIIGGGKQTKELEKSIAVLPFLDDSQDKENTSFINGLMDEVLINLQTIKDLRVPGRTSVEQYRNNVTKSIPEIARELGVNYIVEGSGQKYGNTFRLRVQLIEAAKDRHLWGESYEKKIEKVEDIFSIQNQIAESIASELKAIITPEEKQLIEKVLTTSLTAYDFYQRGWEEYWEYGVDNKNTEALEKAEDLYHEALKYDPTFAKAYTGIAWVYWTRHYWESILSEDYMDSILTLCDIALSYDDQLSDAYTLRGSYYNQISKSEQALIEYDKALKFNPNDWMAYMGKGFVYWNYDLVKSLENFQKAISVNHGSQLPYLLRNIGDVLLDAGFMDKAKIYFQEALKLNGDSLIYYGRLATYEDILGNSSKAIEYRKKQYEIDSSDINTLWWLGMPYLSLGKYEDALKYFTKWLKKSENLSDVTFFGFHRIGFVYWQLGNRKEAQYYFNESIKYCEKLKTAGNYNLYRINYDLAAVYAFLGDKEKAYEYLNMWAKMPVCPYWWIPFLETDDPLFSKIRSEPEFQQIVRDQESKYQAEHERVRKWLEEQGML